MPKKNKRVMSKDGKKDNHNGETRKSKQEELVTYWRRGLNFLSFIASAPFIHDESLTPLFSQIQLKSVTFVCVLLQLQPCPNKKINVNVNLFDS